MYRYALFGALLMGAAAPLHAQDPDFEKFKARENEQLRQFMSREDRDFADFLKREWKAFNVAEERKPYTAPKPVKLPSAPPRASALPMGASAGPRPNVVPTNGLEPLPDIPPTTLRPLAPPAAVSQRPPAFVLPTIKNVSGEASIGNAAALTRFRVPFFGDELALSRGELLVKPLPAKITGDVVASFWEQMAASNWEVLLTQAVDERKRLHLGDWPYAQMLYRTGERVTGDSTRAKLFTWFMLVKSGYAARVGYSNDDIFVLLPSNGVLYGASYFGSEKGKYYLLDLNGGEPPRATSLYTYAKDYPGSERKVDFNMEELPHVAAADYSRTLKFVWNGQPYAFTVHVNRNLMNLLEYYPQTDLDGYFDAAVSLDVRTQLEEGLAPILKGKSELEKVSVLLRFVQTAFEYKTDDDQFKREKWFFPEETIFYPFSDCEDRSILFSWLVRDMVGLEVVGLHWPQHVATAVKFTGDVKGDAVMVDGARFVISDPTYIGAPVGEAMPDFRNVAPRVVRMRPVR